MKVRTLTTLMKVEAALSSRKRGPHRAASGAGLVPKAPPGVRAQGPAGAASRITEPRGQQLRFVGSVFVRNANSNQFDGFPEG